MTTQRDDFLRLETVDLLTDEVAARMEVSRAMLMNTRLDVTEDIVRDTLVASIRKRFLTYDHGTTPETHSEWSEVEFTTPASWWQAFKLSAIRDGNPFFDPGKVRYRTETRGVRLSVTWSMRTGFPEMPMEIPNSGRPFHYLKPASTRIDFGGHS